MSDGRRGHRTDCNSNTASTQQLLRIPQPTRPSDITETHADVKLGLGRRHGQRCIGRVQSELCTATKHLSTPRQRLQC